MRDRHQQSMLVPLIIIYAFSTADEKMPHTVIVEPFKMRALKSGSYTAHDYVVVVRHRVKCDLG